MTKPIAIIGFGGHARVVLSALRAAGRRVIAATCLQTESATAADAGLELMSDQQLTQRFTPDSVTLVLGLGGVDIESTDGRRRSVVADFQRLGFGFSGLVHPTAWVAPEARVAETAQIHAGAIVQPGAVVEGFSILNTKASIDHDCHVGKFCHLAPGVTLSGSVVVNDGCHLGTGATVIQGIEIGAEAFVAAGATVVKSLPSGERVRGVPARRFAAGQNAREF